MLASIAECILRYYLGPYNRRIGRPPRVLKTKSDWPEMYAGFSEVPVLLSEILEDFLLFDDDLPTYVLYHLLPPTPIPCSDHVWTVVVVSTSGFMVAYLRMNVMRYCECWYVGVCFNVADILWQSVVAWISLSLAVRQRQLLLRT